MIQTVSDPEGIRGGGSLVTNRSSVAPLIVKGNDREDPALTKWFYGRHPLISVCISLAPWGSGVGAPDGAPW